MRGIPTDFPGLFVVEPKVFGDHRGFFVETYNRRVFAELGMDYDFVQDNHARSNQKGVLRGLHFQTPPAAQAKLVWVTRGAVFDVVVDLRQGSPTYGRWYGLELSEDNFKRLMIPAGFAHGYVTLTDVAEFQYKVDAFYSPGHDGGIAWNDPDLAVPWPVERPVLSEKDAALPRLRDFDSPFVFFG
ncbi:dTDP-4-dehydrorhamnose 3,5-epimerase [Desulfolutivibrio sulfoxidireducens]|uniref:dTDP-4-dehydrorhamnose 3,5-epimerase n=1 Tax=Desulfolutivibrio sulfoxidireducens TaxID=2773299 RepID=UPI00159DCD54|nr:dTDP-4-dehydrorhamnose 3,5-epimerase [Desulfolutivibrio sulfoxidireducens]QLA15841.1 dTDP-4-dehydrorhamnose 3,5-epimerase [Desulfolutivibrio sulfoxidireducens]QLA20257.1 dTDP-4-dehydrorhamnose 3,5-epimerase [Desulfolutivibrio sulfoxidireducens]